jgi:hypothetical protein
MKDTSFIALSSAVLSKTLLVIGAFSFFFGGRAIAEFTRMDRVSAEVVGIAFAFVFVALGFGLKSFVKKINRR